MRTSHQATLLIGGLLASTAAWPQGNWPVKPITFVVATAPGASNDIESRMYGQKLSEAFGQPFVMDYKPGAGTSLSAIHVAKAAPDGYTMLCISSSFSAVSALYRSLPYDPIRDFTPVSLMSKRWTVLVVHPSAPFRTVQEYIAYTRANPGKVNIATSGAGSGPHINAAWLHSLVNTQVTYVHYKSAAAMQGDLLSGRVEMTYGSLLTGMPNIKSGKTRILAIGNAERSTVFPDIPSVAEQVPGYDYSSITGYLAPANLPPAILARLSTEMTRASKAPDVVKRLEAEGGIPVGSTPAQFAQFLAVDIPRYRKLVVELGIKAED